MIPEHLRHAAWYLPLFACGFFLAGLSLLVLKRSLTIKIMGVFFIFNAAGVLFLSHALQTHEYMPLIIAFFIMAFSVVELVVGFALVHALYRQTGSADSDSVRSLRR